MARLNVYVPDELADAARAAALNVSAVTQAALRQALEAQALDTWLSSLSELEPVSVRADAAQRALDEARNELWDDD